MEEIPSGCIAGWAAAQLTNTCLNSCSCSSFKFCGLPVPTWSGQDTSHSISPGNPECHRDLPVQERPAVAQAVARENRQGLSQKFRKDRRWRSAGGARCYRNSLPTSGSSLSFLGLSHAFRVCLSSPPCVDTNLNLKLVENQEKLFIH